MRVNEHLTRIRVDRDAGFLGSPRAPLVSGNEGVSKRVENRFDGYAAFPFQLFKGFHHLKMHDYFFPGLGGGVNSRTVRAPATSS